MNGHHDYFASVYLSMPDPDPQFFSEQIRFGSATLPLTLPAEFVQNPSKYFPLKRRELLKISNICMFNGNEFLNCFPGAMFQYLNFQISPFTLTQRIPELLGTLMQSM